MRRAFPTPFITLLLVLTCAVFGTAKVMEAGVLATGATPTVTEAAR